MSGAGRFAPSTTGLIHPGTLLAALLAWLDARAHGLRFVLRLDDADPGRCKPAWAAAAREDLEACGLDWDGEQSQQARRGAHEAALDRLAASGRLYACRCSRADVRRIAQPGPDGGWRYPGTCRERVVGVDQWRHSTDPLRVRLDDGPVEVADEGGLHLEQDAADSLGDPVVQRRDGAIAYQLSVVVDDADAGVTRVVRGRDLASQTAVQAQLHDLLELPWPRWRHHALLLEERTEGIPGGTTKLAKLHGSVDVRALWRAMTPAACCGRLAHAVGLLSQPEECRPRDLLDAFDWRRIRAEDLLLHWDGTDLRFTPASHLPGDVERV
ncbi:MAG: glutamate--tRNA ligase family protein [Planctomycetota bacterium]